MSSALTWRELKWFDYVLTKQLLLEVIETQLYAFTYAQTDELSFKASFA